jgi:hypothetical protein
MSGQTYTDVSVVFEDVHFHRATAIPKKGTYNCTVIYMYVCVYVYICVHKLELESNVFINYSI